MDLRQRTEEVIASIRKLKTDWVAANPKDPDLATYLYFFRGDDLIAWVQAPMDPESALTVARMGRIGFAATTLCIAHEGYNATTKESPVTGRPWGPGEKQFVYETDPMASAKGWVDSAIIITCHEYGGKWLFAVLPFKIRRGKLTWLEDREVISTSEDEDVQDAGGGVHDALQEVMTFPTTTDRLFEAAELNPVFKFMADHLGEEERLFHSDMATHRQLLKHNLAMAIEMVAEPGSDRERWLTERLGKPDE